MGSGANSEAVKRFGAIIGFLPISRRTFGAITGKGSYRQATISVGDRLDRVLWPQGKMPESRQRDLAGPMS